jgi:hypothetical protein
LTSSVLDETRDENFNFIADALYSGGNGSAKDKIRRYFLKDFYKDQVIIFQNGPSIGYWTVAAKMMVSRP